MICLLNSSEVVDSRYSAFLVVLIFLDGWQFLIYKYIASTAVVYLMYKTEFSTVKANLCMQSHSEKSR